MLAQGNALTEHKVNYLCAATIVMSLVLAGQADHQMSGRVQFLTTPAPPPEGTLADTGAADFDVVHLYGLTETYGPAVVNDWHEQWNDLPLPAQAGLKARQGVRYLPLEGQEVSAQELLDWCHTLLAGYKVPGHIEFCTIPRTATGKIQKFVLRQTARKLA